MQVTSSTSSSVSQNAASSATTAGQSLTQQDFLQLLVKQMTSQDPMNPQSDTNFIAQMAQFTSLEQSQTMSSDMAAMREEQNVLQATSLLGATVTLQADKSNTTQGVVSAVQFQAGKPQLVVNGQNYTLDQLITVTPTPVSE